MPHQAPPPYTMSWKAKCIYYCMKALGALPRVLLYAFSDVIAWTLYSIIGYRKAVVQQQLLASFPNTNPTQLRLLTKGVYQYLADLFVEFCMLAHMNEEKLKQSISLEGVENLEALYQKGHKQVYLALGHYGNWEWFTGFQQFLKFTQMYVLYKPQSAVTEEVMNALRSKFGALLIDKNQAPRTVLRLAKNGDNTLLIFVADQTPSVQNIHLFVNFLNRSTAVFTGMERMAAKTHSPVCYLDVFAEKRGQYRCVVEVLCEDASQWPEGEVTTMFMKRLEQTILRRPSLWLWTHKRWKHDKERLQAKFPNQHIIS